MHFLTHAEIEKMACDLWGPKAVLKLVLEGSDCALVHPRGFKSVFALRRGDLTKPAEEFSESILMPCIVKLREMVEAPR